MNRVFAIIPIALSVFFGAMELVLAEFVPSGAIQISEAEYTKIHKNNVVEGRFYKEDGAIGGSFVADFRVDGIKKFTAKPKQGKTISATAKWHVEDGVFCHQGIPSMVMRCGARGLVFKLGNTCFHTRSDHRTVRLEFAC